MYVYSHHMSGALSSQTKLRPLSPVLTLRLSLNLLLILLRHSSQSHLPSHQPILGELSRPYCSNTSRAFGAKAFSRPTPSITVSTQSSQTERVHRSQMGSPTRQSCSVLAEVPASRGMGVWLTPQTAL